MHSKVEEKDLEYPGMNFGSGYVSEHEGEGKLRKYAIYISN